jgi:hypothetical protein
MVPATAAVVAGSAQQGKAARAKSPVAALAWPESS